MEPGGAVVERDVDAGEAIDPAVEERRRVDDAIRSDVHVECGLRQVTIQVGPGIRTVFGLEDAAPLRGGVGDLVVARVDLQTIDTPSLRAVHRYQVERAVGIDVIEPKRHERKDYPHSKRGQGGEEH